MRHGVTLGVGPPLGSLNSVKATALLNIWGGAELLQRRNSPEVP